EGPNVMLGYAENRKDLSRSDENMGVLFTGDLGKCDSSGCFYVTGRLKRFIKIKGARFNLDDFEKMIENTYGYSNMCYGEDDNLFVIIKSSDFTQLPRIEKDLSKYYNIHQSVININFTSSLPYNNLGKPDYSRVMKNIN
ncbi:MAG: AMP-binding protein, partial [Melioribacteraceae bacterium]|nr:AMP-binding protein [Melioribacteraceae bacterium]